MNIQHLFLPLLYVLLLSAVCLCRHHAAAEIVAFDVVTPMVMGRISRIPSLRLLTDTDVATAFVDVFPWVCHPEHNELVDLTPHFL